MEYRTRCGFGYLVWRQRFTMPRRTFSLPHTPSSSEMTWSPGISATGNDSANESARSFRSLPVRSTPIQIVPCQESQEFEPFRSIAKPESCRRKAISVSVSRRLCGVIVVDSACVVNHKGPRPKTFTNSNNTHLRSSEAMTHFSPSLNMLT